MQYSNDKKDDRKKDDTFKQQYEDAFEYKKNESNKPQFVDKRNIVWKTRYSTKDFDMDRVKIRISILIIISICLFLLSYIFEVSKVKTAIIILLNGIFFYIIQFYNEGVETAVTKMGYLREVTNFKDDIYFFKNKNMDTIFIKNGNEKVITGLYCLRVPIMPISIKSNPYYFIKILQNEKINFTYQFSYLPDITDTNPKNDDDKQIMAEEIIDKMDGRIAKMSSMLSDRNYIPQNEVDAKNYGMEITFTFFHSAKIRLDVNETIKEIEKNHSYSYSLVNNLIVECFTHYQFERLKGMDLIHVLQPGFSLDVTLLDEEYDRKDVEKRLNVKLISVEDLIKSFYALFISLVIIYSFWGYSLTKSWGQSLRILMIFFTIFYVGYQVVSGYLISKNLIYHSKINYTFFNPFEKVQLYKHSSDKAVMFIYFKQQKILQGIRYLNVKTYGSFFYYHYDKAIHSITRLSKHPVIHTMIMNVPDKSRIGSFKRSYLHESVKNLKTFGGIFDVMNFYGTYAFERIDELNSEALTLVADRLWHHIKDIYAGLQTYMTGPSPHVWNVRDNKFSLRVFLVNCIKCNRYYTLGSRFYKIPMTSKELSAFIQIKDETRRGIKTLLPSEFNTPISAYSDINFGMIFNTTKLDAESKTGIDYRHLERGISISSYDDELNDLWTMAIVNQLIYNGLNTIIFDLYGRYSAIYGEFKDNVKKDNIKLLKMGDNFSIDLLKTDSKVLKEEEKYLKTLIKCFAIAYEFDFTEENILEIVIRNQLKNAPNPAYVDMSALDQMFATMLKDFSPTLINNVRNIITRLFHDKYINSFRLQTTKDYEFSKIVFEPNTYIIDLSELEYQEKMLTQMVIIAKIAHYQKLYHDNNLKSKQFSGSKKLKSYIQDTRKTIVMKDPIEHLGNLNLKRFPHIPKLIQIMRPIKDSGYGVIFQSTNLQNISEDIERICKSHLVLKTTNPHERMTKAKLIQLDAFKNGESIHGGRKNSYQEEFMNKLPFHLGIMKHYNRPFPFPIELDISKLMKIKRPTKEETLDLMNNIGQNTDEILQAGVKINSKSTIETDFHMIMLDIEKIIQTIDRIINATDSQPVREKFIKETIRDYTENSLRTIFRDEGTVKEKKKLILDILKQKSYIEPTYNSNISGSANPTKLWEATEKCRESLLEFNEKQENKKAIVKDVDIYDEDDDIEKEYYDFQQINQNQEIDEENEYFNNLIEKFLEASKNWK